MSTDSKQPAPAESLPIPGLDTPTGRAVPALEVAVRRTLAALADQGLVHEVDAGKAALAIEMAQVIASKKSSGKASTIGNDARVLMEILDAFVGDADESVDAVLRQAMEDWAAVMTSGDAAAQVRDST